MDEEQRQAAAELGKLERVDPRQVWIREDHDFTPWLLGNADGLAEALGIELELEGAEHRVGGYSLDLIGRDISNGAVLIVENQLGPTDHSHLGQILTYAAGTAASTIVWIATAFREEHRQALDWLNEHTGEDTHFFGIELQLVRIGDSARAPLFNVVVQPNDWQKQVRAATQSSAVTGKGVIYVEFWTRFFERQRAEHPGWRRSGKPAAQNWVDMTASRPDMWFSNSFAQGERLRSQLVIDSQDAERNLELFAYFHERREQFEQAYGRPLSWEDLPHRRSCAIADYNEGCSVNQQQRWDEYIDWFFDSGKRLRNALSTVGTPPLS